jgi:glycosyltransferase involved in cell wall biosynthesis
MRIWIVNHYADPPDGQATRSFDIASRMAERGHPTTIFASNFSHYHFGPRRPMLGLCLWRTETIQGVRFIWLRGTPYRRNDWRRVVNMVAFSMVAVLSGSVVRPKPDVVIGVSVHPLGAVAGYFVSKIRRARFFSEITDLWPQTLIDFGLLAKDSVTARLMRSLERFIYQHSERIVMLWRHTDEYVSSLGVSPDKIIWIPHGVELARYDALAPYKGGNINEFRVMFLGGFAAGNSIETILEAAAVLQERQRHGIRFLLIGAGQERARMMQLATELHLENVEFRDAVPKAEIGRVMNEADAFIYGLKDLPLYRFGISHNKMTDYLAAGRPILFFGNSTYDPVADSGAGISVAPGNPSVIADAIERLVGMSDEARMEMGRRGRAYLLEHHHIPRLADRLLASLGAS